MVISIVLNSLHLRNNVPHSDSLLGISSSHTLSPSHTWQSSWRVLIILSQNQGRHHLTLQIMEV